jgi:hypothetical protein
MVREKKVYRSFVGGKRGKKGCERAKARKSKTKASLLLGFLFCF